MRIDIVYKDNSKIMFSGVTSYSDLAFADEWFWVDLEDGERQYISISTIKRIKVAAEKETEV